MLNNIDLELKERFQEITNSYVKSVKFLTFINSQLSSRIFSSNTWKSIISADKGSLGELLEIANADNDLGRIVSIIQKDMAVINSFNAVSVGIIIDTDSLIKINWLKPLLLDGDGLIDFNGKHFRIPPEFSGVKDDNFITKALRNLDNEIGENIAYHLIRNF